MSLKRVDLLKPRLALAKVLDVEPECINDLIAKLSEDYWPQFNRQTRIRVATGESVTCNSPIGSWQLTFGQRVNYSIMGDERHFHATYDKLGDILYVKLPQ